MIFSKDLYLWCYRDQLISLHRNNQVSLYRQFGIQFIEFDNRFQMYLADENQQP